MNMQAMMQQAQKIQRDIMKSKKEIENKTYVCTQSFVTVETKGTKEITKITINQDSLDKDDIEILQDLIVIAANENIKAINKDTESKLGKFGEMAGLL